MSSQTDGGTLDVVEKNKVVLHYAYMASVKTIKIVMVAGFLVLAGIIVAAIVDTVLSNRALERERQRVLAAIPPEIVEKLQKERAAAEAQLRENDRLVLPYIIIASVDKMLGDLKNAEAMLKRAAQIAPTNHLALGNLANVYRELEKNKEAEIAYERALKYGPSEEQNYLQYADFLRYRVKESHDRVKALYEQGLETLDGNVNVRKAYAGYLRDAGELGAALEQWRLVLVTNPDDVAVQEEIREIESLDRK